MTKIQKLSKDLIKHSLKEENDEFCIGDLVCEKANPNNLGYILFINGNEITISIEMKIYKDIWEKIADQSNASIDQHIIKELSKYSKMVNNE